MIRLLLILCILWAGDALAEMRDLPHITVLADASLTAPITELARSYSSQKNITITASYNSTSEQAWKIEEGESADMFISAHPYWMSELKQKGLIDVYSLTNLVKNKLALIVSVKGRVNEFDIPQGETQEKLEFLNNRVIMVIGEPNYTALGMYTKQALRNLSRRTKSNLWGQVEQKTIKSMSSNNNLYLISNGETAGITFFSDAYKNPEVRVISMVSETLHDPVIYQAAVVAGENMEYARGFLQFLQSKESKQVFRSYGFSVD